jgi:hypothetical protein
MRCKSSPLSVFIQIFCQQQRNQLRSLNTEFQLAVHVAASAFTTNDIDGANCPDIDGDHSLSV